MHRYLQKIADLAKGRPEPVRSPLWDKTRHAHLQTQPACQWCKTVKKLEVHHIEPYHLAPSSELDPKNLITLCDKCHFVAGHNCNWKSFNQGVKYDCDIHRTHL